MQHFARASLRRVPRGGIMDSVITDEPAQTTPKGAEIPVPTREQVMRDLCKVWKKGLNYLPSGDGRTETARARNAAGRQFVRGDRGRGHERPFDVAQESRLGKHLPIGI